MATPKRPHKPSNNEKAAARIEALIKAGVVVKVDAFSGYYTVGPYQLATGQKGFGVFAYGAARRGLQEPDREFFGRDAAASAAQVIVARCGSTRAREAALNAERKIARHIGPF